MAGKETGEVLARLVAAMRELAAATTDASVASTAACYAELLGDQAIDRAEHLVRQVRDELSNHKTNFTDSFDVSERFEQARESARVQAQAAVNHFVCLRRPDLGVVVNAVHEA